MKQIIPRYNKRKIKEDLLKQYLYKDKLPYKEIALRFGVIISSITSFMRCYNYPKRGRSPNLYYPHDFKTGHTPWNKGKKSNLIPWNKKYPDFWICKQCGIKFPNKNGHKGIFCSRECHRLAQVDGKYLKGTFQKGSYHPNWRDGSSLSKYPTKWNEYLRDKIRERDNYKCTMCGVPQEECLRKLDVHHKDENKNNLGLNNLISYCHSCHQKVHWEQKRNKIYG